MNEQQLAALRTAFKELNKKERHHTVAETRYWCDQYRLFAERLLVTFAQREPVAEGEVQRYSPAIYRSATSNSKPIMKPNNFGDYVYLPDWQRTEAARLAATKNADEWFATARSFQKELAAERERSEKLVEALRKYEQD